MRAIAHRGNLDGPCAEENKPDHVLAAIAEGFEVEVDAWFSHGHLALGHDGPQYGTSQQFLNAHRDSLFVHCKNREALSRLMWTGVRIFWHENDAYTLSNYGDLFINPKAELATAGILLMPELSAHPQNEIVKCMGVCTDFPLKWRDL